MSILNLKCIPITAPILRNSKPIPLQPAASASDHGASSTKLTNRSILFSWLQPITAARPIIKKYFSPVLFLSASRTKWAVKLSGDQKYLPPFNPSAYDMVYRTGCIYSGFSGHLFLIYEQFWIGTHNFIPVPYSPHLKKRRRNLNNHPGYA